MRIVGAISDAASFDKAESTIPGRNTVAATQPGFRVVAHTSRYIRPCWRGVRLPEYSCPAPETFTARFMRHLPHDGDTLMGGYLNRSIGRYAQMDIL